MYSINDVVNLLDPLVQVETQSMRLNFELNQGSYKLQHHFCDVDTYQCNIEEAEVLRRCIGVAEGEEVLGEISGYSVISRPV
ncbi:MAG: hypothetical protein EZS28_031039 [Streblomastix strix]|uniref:Uncharacterized protein n=1 Tax=Streblomastix strix TaxID=222440 RepID=A0A5J4USU1_9EUKA|nr:MAG: hypothetical protein EZS28_031039 [Streblomastix strix]